MAVGRIAAGAIATVALAATLAACGGPPAQPTASPSADPSTTSGPSSTASSTASNTAPSPSPSASSPTAGPSTPTSGPSTQEPAGDQITIDISIKGGKVDPSGKKIDVPLGATVVLNVTSDSDDEIHAHIGSGDGYSLEVKAGEPARGRFVLDSPGSFEVESHHLEKIIAILNVR